MCSPRRRKSRKRKRPSTAKYGFGNKRSRLASSSMRRPGTAKRRKKSKKRRRREYQQYLQNLQNQQLLHQLAMQQQMNAEAEEQNQNFDPEDPNQNLVQAMIQNNINPADLVDENGNQIQLTPEQLAELQQTWAAVSADPLTPVQQANEEEQQPTPEEQLAQLTPEQFAMLQQQVYEQQMQESTASRKKRRPGSKKRRKKKSKAKRRKLEEQAALQQMLQQHPELQMQLMQQQEMMNAGQDMEGAEEGQLYGVDKIPEEEHEESPMKSQGRDSDEEAPRHYEQPTEESGHREGQEFAADQEGENGEGMYEEENVDQQQLLQNMNPQALAFLQQKAAEQNMMGYPNKGVDQHFYSPHQGNHRNLYEDQANANNIIYQNEALNSLLQGYAADVRKKELEKARRRKKKAKNRRRSFAAIYGPARHRGAAIPYRRGMDLKRNIRRDVKQLKLAKKIYMLANEIERNRLLEEKRRIQLFKKAKRSKMKSSMRSR